MSAPAINNEEMCPLQRWITEVQSTDSTPNIENTLLNDDLVTEIDENAVFNEMNIGRAYSYGKFLCAWMYQSESADFSPFSTEI